MKHDDSDIVLDMKTGSPRKLEKRVQIDITTLILCKSKLTARQLMVKSSITIKVI